MKLNVDSFNMSLINLARIEMKIVKIVKNLRLTENNCYRKICIVSLVNFAISEIFGKTICPSNILNFGIKPDPDYISLWRNYSVKIFKFQFI